MLARRERLFDHRMVHVRRRAEVYNIDSIVSEKLFKIRADTRDAVFGRDSFGKLAVRFAEDAHLRVDAIGAVDAVGVELPRETGSAEPHADLLIL